MVSRRTVVRGLLGLTVALPAGATVYGSAYERHHIEVTQATLQVAGLPPALEGLRIGLLTDIHHSRVVSAEQVTQAVELAMSYRPDLIVLGGDYVTYGQREFIGPVAELLSALDAPHGVFATLGNHDPRAAATVLASRGIEVLSDARTRIEIRGEPLELAGVRYRTRRLADIAAVVGKPSATLILLAHDPRRLTEAAMLKVPVVLSGHTHGGQIVLPAVGAVAGRRFPVLAGLGAKSDTSIFVSRGIGTVLLPMRINCPPEVAILTLGRRSHATSAAARQQRSQDQSICAV
jgi:predicted MPP superfamily phosphohydrolase